MALGEKTQINLFFHSLIRNFAPRKPMNQHITFSVITITFNAEACLQRTLDSVLKQSYPYIEHLIVDGASKDNTVAIAEAYAAKSPHKVIISSEPDRGLYDAMNKGLQRATGDYIIYMNAGDSFPNPDTLAHVANSALDSTKPLAISQQPLASVKDRTYPAVLYGDTNWTDNDGNYIGKRNHSAPAKLSWRSFKHGMLVCHQAFYARLDIARRFPYDLKYRHSADIDWCIRIMKEAEAQNLPLVNVNEVIANYQREGQTTANHKASLKERYHIMCKHYGTTPTILMHLWFVIRGIIRKLT